MADSGRIGKSVRIILVGGFHYTGIILNEDENFLTIKDKFGADVSIRKLDIQVLEVSNGGRK